MLVSPAEPDPYRRLGRSSSLPERVGSDFLIFSPCFGRVGVQRKTVLDLVASASDGRFQRELIEMKGCDVGVWLFEGRPDWTSDGRLLSSRTNYRKEQHFGMIFSLLSQGYWMLQASSADETCWLLSDFEKWLRKSEHKGISARPGPARNLFGETDVSGWQAHFLQGLPGMGVERAKAWLEEFGGLGMRLDRDPEQVSGVGKVTAGRIREIFR
jgi:ERCC4-type nuclease